MLEGYETVFRAIEDSPKDSKDRPLQPVIIANCGVYDSSNPPPAFDPAAL